MSGNQPLDEIQRAARDQFARQSHRYGQGHILADVADIRAAIEPLNLPSGARVLDVATGGGHTGLYLASLGHRVTLTDIAEPMLHRAAAAAAERGLKVATCLHAAEQLPYPDASFDLVISRVAPHHFSSPGAFVTESARVLAPGGWFVVLDGSIEDGQPEAEAWIHALEKLRDPSHARFLSPQTWRGLCQTARLQVKEAALSPFKQPDLNWYFDNAATTPENRAKVLDMIAHAPQSARDLFRIATEDAKIVWWWQRITLVAFKPN